MSSSFTYSHFTAGAVETDCKLLTVVKEEQWAGILAAMMFRAHSKLISDAVSGAHEFGFRPMCQFICLFDVYCPAFTIKTL